MEHTFGTSLPRPLPPDDPRITISDKTYVGYKALGMGFDAHLTVMYLGQITGLQAALTEKVINIYKDHPRDKYTTVRRLKFNMFGPNKDIPVIEVAVPTSLHNLRESLEAHSYLPNPSEFAWNPHITLKVAGDEPIFIPSFIVLGNLGLY